MAGTVLQARRGASRVLLGGCALAVGVLAGCASRPAIEPASPATELAPSEAAAPAPLPPGDPENLLALADEIVIERPPERVLAVLEQPESYRHILPLVKRLAVRERSSDGSLLLEIEQGVSLVSGSYTVRIRRTGERTIEFAIDHRFPSVLRDGHVTVELRPEEGDRTRVVYAATADIGDRWSLHLIKGRLQRAMSRPPVLLKRHVER